MLNEAVIDVLFDKKLKKIPKVVWILKLNDDVHPGKVRETQPGYF